MQLIMLKKFQKPRLLFGISSYYFQQMLIFGMNLTDHSRGDPSQVSLDYV